MGRQSMRLPSFFLCIFGKNTHILVLNKRKAGKEYEGQGLF